MATNTWKVSRTTKEQREREREDRGKWSNICNADLHSVFKHILPQMGRPTDDDSMENFVPSEVDAIKFGVKNSGVFALGDHT